MTYIRKDILASLKSDAQMAEKSCNYVWAKLFRESAALIKKQKREIDRLRALILAMED